MSCRAGTAGPTVDPFGGLHDSLGDPEAGDYTYDPFGQGLPDTDAGPEAYPEETPPMMEEQPELINGTDVW